VAASRKRIILQARILDGGVRALAFWCHLEINMMVLSYLTPYDEVE
jgi:hypothetical protein